MKTENEDIKILTRLTDFYFNRKENTKDFLTKIKKYTYSEIRENCILKLQKEIEEQEKNYHEYQILLKKLEGVPVFDYKAIEELKNVFLKHGILDPRGDVCKKIIEELRSIRKPS